MADTKEVTEPGTSVSPISDDVRDVNPVSTGSTDLKSGSPFETVLQQICQFLAKSEEQLHVDYEKLIITFKYLQKCSLSSTLVYLLEDGILEVVGRTYDKLVQEDYGKREVLSSILELLYLIEDMSESVEGKTQCGKYFINRLLALATTEVKSVNLHRAAVETLCAIITKSPVNQQRVIDDRAACLKLFKQRLPSCGDFQLQASLTEVYYRLLKLDPQLLDFMSDRRVRGAMESLVRQQKPDLLARIKEFVILLNESMGPLRSVYTFFAAKILLNGQNVTPSEEKLISFGKAHFSFYQTDINIDGPTILDVGYKDILELKSGSKSILEMVVQDKQNVLPAQATSLSQYKQVRILVSMDPHDFSLLEKHVLPKLQTQTISTKRGLSSPGMRKSSIGIMNPQSKDSSLTSQLRNEAERFLPAPPRGILKKSDVNICQTSNIDVSPKENWSNPNDGPAQKEKNFSEEPVIVKATPQKDLSSHSRCKEFPSTQMRNRGVELGSSPDASNEGYVENAEDFGARVPLSRILKRLNEYVDPKETEFQIRHQRPEFSKDKGNDHHLEERKYCNNSEVNETRVEVDTTTNAFSANKETVGRHSRRSVEKENQRWTLEEMKGVPQVQVSDCREHYQSSGSGLGVDMKSTKDHVDYKSRTSFIPLHEIGQDGSLLMNLKIRNRFDDIYGFETGPAVEEAKDTSETSGKKKMEKVESFMTGKAPPDKKTGDSSPKKKRIQVVRKYPTRRTTCKKPKSQSSDSKPKSDSDRTLTSNNDEEWAPDKENTDPIETESEERKVGAAKKTCQRKGSLQQKSCNNTGRKGDLPIRLQSAKSIMSKGILQHTSLPSAVQRRKTANTDVYTFTSDDEERPQCKSKSILVHETGQVGKPLSRKGRATTLSFTNIPEQPGKVRLISRAFEGISQGPNKAQKVQKEDKKDAGEPGDNDVLIISKQLYRREVHTSSTTERVQKRSRIDRWKSSSYTDHTILESNVEPEQSIDVPSSDTSAGGMSQKTGTDVKVPDNCAVSADDKGVQVITTLIREFKDRVKSETKRKMTDIVSNTSLQIQHGIEGTQQLIQKDVADFVQISKEKYGQINNKLEGHTKRMRQVYDQFQKDFDEHVQQYEKIVEEIDETDRTLTDVARKRGQEHKELFERLQETSMRHLAAADQTILSVSKASEAMYGLRSAVEGLMCLEN